MQIHWAVKLLVGVLVLVAIVLVLLAWSVNRSPRQEAAGQELTVPTVTAPTTSPPAPTAPGAFPEVTEEFILEPQPEGIPGLSVMEVIGDLKHFRAEGGFVCDGPAPAEGDGSLWFRSAPEGKRPATYELTLLADGPLTIRWVRATARGVPEERAAEFLSYVASLCLQDTDPLNAEAWVGQNVGPGGQVFAQGAELTIYGTKEERTLEVVATSLATD